MGVRSRAPPSVFSFRAIYFKIHDLSRVESMEGGLTISPLATAPALMVIYLGIGWNLSVQFRTYAKEWSTGTRIVERMALVFAS